MNHGLVLNTIYLKLWSLEWEYEHTGSCIEELIFGRMALNDVLHMLGRDTYPWK